MKAPESGTFSLPGKLVPWLLIAAGALVYANSLDAPFVFDDLGAIVENKDIQHLWPLWLDPQTSERPSLNGRPLVRFSLALNYAFGGLEVRGYHAVNIALHILCALLLFGLVRRTLLTTNRKPEWARSATSLAFCCALLWMVHPLHNQCINYIIQRSEVLAGLFYLASFYCAQRGFSSHHTRRWHSLAILACALGMASKETMLTAPLLILTYERIFHPASWRQLWHRHGGFYLGLAATWSISALLLASSPHGDSIGFTGGIDAWTYALNQCLVVADYLQKALWPHPLILDYGFPRMLRLGVVWPQAMLLAMLLALVALGLRYKPEVGFLGLWFFVILAPTSSFVPLVNEVGAERRIYLSLAALVVLLVVALDWLTRRWTLHLSPNRSPVWRALVVVPLAGALSLGTVERNRDHCDALSLWQTVVDAVPHNPRAHTYLGLALIEAGQFDRALVHYRQALQLKSDYAEAHNNLAIALGLQGRSEEAIHHYTRALQLNPNLLQAYNNLGNALMARGQLDQAIAYFTRALQLKSTYADAHNNMGIALGLQGRSEEAVAHFRQALLLRPAFAAAKKNLSIARRAKSPAP